MSYSFSAKSLKHLEGVHPDLVRVAKRAIQLTDIDFGITEGIRSYSRQVQLMHDNKTTTLRSQHLLQPSGYGHAIDVFAYVNGQANWTNQYYGPIAQAFFEAAIEEGIQIRAGHLWRNFKDSCHFELNRAFY